MKGTKSGKVELTKTAVILGILLAVLFGGANAYLGLRVGMTVSGSSHFHGNYKNFIKERVRVGE